MKIIDMRALMWTPIILIALMLFGAIAESTYWTDIKMVAKGIIALTIVVVVIYLAFKLLSESNSVDLMGWAVLFAIWMEWIPVWWFVVWVVLWALGSGLDNIRAADRAEIMKNIDELKCNKCE